MKWVARLPAEPAVLAAYRVLQPEDANASGTDAKAAWNRFRADAAYKQVRDELVKIQHGLCAYCEQRVTSETGVLIELDQQIEHVLPKSGGAGRTLDWTNFMLCCGGGCCRHHTELSRYSPGSTCSCGQSKADDLLDPGCDPRGLPSLYRVVDVGMDGTIAANRDACQRAGIPPEELDRTLNNTLNLNCERLRRAREEVLRNVRTWIVPVLQSFVEASHLNDDRREQFLLLLVEGRLSLDRYGHLRAFWTAERQYLEPLSDTWIAQNVQFFGYPAPESLGGTPP